MKSNKKFTPWKNPDDKSIGSPIENPNVNPDMLAKVRGGAGCSTGWICTISGECPIQSRNVCNVFTK